jgi:hypothetical protein
VANPLLIGGLVIGGAVAAWRLTRHYRRRLRKLAGQIAMPRHAATGRPVPLEQDPATGIYRPSEDSRRGRN